MIKFQKSEKGAKRGEEEKRGKKGAGGSKKGQMPLKRGKRASLNADKVYRGIKNGFLLATGNFSEIFLENLDICPFNIVEMVPFIFRPF